MKNITNFMAFLIIMSALSACGSGKSGDSPPPPPPPPPPPWTGTKQLGVKDASTQAYGVAVDSNGNVYVAGYTNGGLDGNTLTGTYDAFLTKYDSSGNKMYTKLLGVAARNTFAYGVAVDLKGNVYMAGSTTGDLDGNTHAGTKDFFLTKYDSEGIWIYTKQLGVAEADTTAYGVAVDLKGNVYVAGSTTGDLDGITHTGTYDAFLTKYDSAGDRKYTKLFGYTNEYTYAHGVAVDLGDDVYVTGSTSGGVGIYDAFLTKYNSATGEPEPTYPKLLGVLGQWTAAWGVVVDSKYNVYVTGDTNVGLDENQLTGTVDAFLTKYDPGGNKLYTKQYGIKYDTAKGSAYGRGVAVDSNDNVYMIGDSTVWIGADPLNEYFLIKYDSAGIKIDTHRNSVFGQVFGQSVAVDSGDNVFLTGYASGEVNGNTLMGIEDFFVSKYDSKGILQ